MTMRIYPYHELKDTENSPEFMDEQYELESLLDPYMAPSDWEKEYEPDTSCE
jgi:hypothetical protein